MEAYLGQVNDTQQLGLGDMAQRNANAPSTWYRHPEVQTASNEYIEKITAKVVQTLTERQAAIDKKREDELSRFMSRVEQMMARIEGTPHPGERQSRRDLSVEQQRQTSSDRPVDNRASSSTLQPLAPTQTVRQARPSTEGEHIVANSIIHSCSGQIMTREKQEQVAWRTTVVCVTLI